VHFSGPAAWEVNLKAIAVFPNAIDNDKYLVNTKMYLAVSAETSQAEIVGRAPQLVKVCSLSHIEHLVKNALPGVPLAIALPEKRFFLVESRRRRANFLKAVVRALELSNASPEETRGETWKPVGPLPEKFSMPKPGWFANVDWDPARGIFYASQMGKGTYKLETK